MPPMPGNPEGIREIDCKRFINGILGCCHVFSTSSYMAKIFSAVIALVNAMPVYTETQAATLGLHIMGAPTRSLNFALLRFLVQVRCASMEASAKHLDAIESILVVLNAGPASLCHVCVAGCRCGGDPKRKLKLAAKVSLNLHTMSDSMCFITCFDLFVSLGLTGRYFLWHIRESHL